MKLLTPSLPSLPPFPSTTPSLPPFPSLPLPFPPPLPPSLPFPPFLPPSLPPSHQAVEMFTDLRQFDLAKEFLVQSDQQNARHLITKQADWARTTNDPQAAWYDLLHAYAVSDTLSCAPVGLLSLKCFSFHSHHLPGVLFFTEIFFHKILSNVCGQT